MRLMQDAVFVTNTSTVALEDLDLELVAQFLYSPARHGDLSFIFNHML
jgi:hypothetical protein